MESDDSPKGRSFMKSCSKCGCSCSLINRSLSGTYLRSVNRKADDLKEESQFTVPGLAVPQNARVEAENECRVLREMVGSQQFTIQELVTELDEERNASASAADEAMSMILRLQREKAEIQMEARQFKRFAEEKMAHDQQEMLALEDLLYKREQNIQSLSSEVHHYKHRMMSYGISEGEVDGNVGEKVMSRNASMGENLAGQLELPQEMYPRLKCFTNESLLSNDDEDEDIGVEKYADSPFSRDQLKDLEFRINQLEQSPRTCQPEKEQFNTKNVHDKVVIGQTPKKPRHSRRFSSESLHSPFAIVKEIRPEFHSDSPRLGSSLRKRELFPSDVNPNQRKMDNASEGEDNMSDRVYTIDSIHQRASSDGAMNLKTCIGISSDVYMVSPKDSDDRDLEIQKLYARLHALEADRETMRQEIISMGTDKAQLVLLKEIAQNLCKDMSASVRMQQPLKPTVARTPSIPIFKWISSVVQWKNKASRYRHMFGASENGEGAGLLMLLNRSSWPKLSRLVSRTNTLKAH